MAENKLNDIDLEKVSGGWQYANGTYVDYGNYIIYTVVAGDCLWTICQRVYGTGTKWGELWAANAAIIENPRLIFPGQVLQLP